MKILIALSLIVLLVACAEPRQQTSAKISVASVTGSTKYSGGILVVARDMKSDQRVARSIAYDETYEFILPNGEWRFFVVGWKGGNTSSIYSGESLCDFRLRENLSGGEKTIDFKLSPDRCAKFYEANGGNDIGGRPIYDTDSKRFISTAVSSCGGIKSYIEEDAGGDALAVVAALDPDVGCNGNNGPGRGEFTAFRVNLMNVDLEKRRTSGLWSQCYELKQSYRNYTEFNFPVTVGNTELRTEFAGYSSLADCLADDGLINQSGVKPEDLKIEKRFRFPGLIEGIGATVEEQNNGFIIFDPSDSQIGGQPVFFAALDGKEREGCSPEEKERLPFAFGDKDANNGHGRYVICTEEQWNNIAKGPENCLDNDGNVSTEMECEPTAEYTLGADIDFGGSNATISDIFQGGLQGNGYVLKNGNQPLFAHIQSNEFINDRTYIRGLWIEGFNISIDSVGNYGVIANLVNTTGTSSARGAEIGPVFIDMTTVIENTVASGDGALGGMVGTVDFSGSTSSNDMFFIRQSQTTAQVQSVSTSMDTDGTTAHATIFATGGMIGKALGAPGGGNVVIEVASVGGGPIDVQDEYSYRPDALDPAANAAIVRGHGHVGGLIGYAAHTEIRSESVAIVTLSGVEQVGGAIGTAGPNTRINSVYTVVNQVDFPSVCSTPGTCVSFGGIIGAKDFDIPGHVYGSISRFNLSHSSYEIDEIGGIIGAVLDTGPNFSIKDTKSVVDINVDGTNIGGLIGVADFGDNTNPNIIGNVIMGNIEQTPDVTTDGISYGAIAGNGQRINISRNIIHDVTITALNDVGGLVGTADGVIASENYIAGVLNATDATSVTIGGAIGNLGNGVGGSNFTGNLVDTIVNVQNITADTTCATANCGEFIGLNAQTGGVLLDYNSVALDTVVEFRDGPEDDVVCGFGCTAGKEYTAGNFRDANDKTVANICTALNLGSFPWVNNGSLCVPQFKNKWVEAGYDSTANEYLAGSILEPFLIQNKADWDAIGDDGFLLTKSYEVVGDIDFLNGNFVPFGGSSATAFSGTLFGDGVIKNINSVDNLSAGDRRGVINRLCGGSVGLRGRPLKFENISISSSDGIASLGLIGSTQPGPALDCDNDNIGVFVEAKNITLTNSSGGSTSDVGGIVARVDGSFEMDETLFSGSLTSVASDTANVGGIFGSVSTSVNVRMSNVGVQLKRISAQAGTNERIGGMVGSDFSAGNAQIDISSAYVWLDRGNANGGTDIEGSTGSDFGGVIGATDDAAKHTLKSIYIDFSSSPIQANITNAGDIYGSMGDSAPSLDNANYPLPVIGTGPGAGAGPGIGSGPGPGTGSGPGPEPGAGGSNFSAFNTFATMLDLINNWNRGSGDWIEQNGALVIGKEDYNSGP